MACLSVCLSACTQQSRAKMPTPVTRIDRRLRDVSVVRPSYQRSAVWALIVHMLIDAETRHLREICGLCARSRLRAPYYQIAHPHLSLSRDCQHTLLPDLDPGLPQTSLVFLTTQAVVARSGIKQPGSN